MACIYNIYMDIGILYKPCLVFCILGEETERGMVDPSSFSTGLWSRVSSVESTHRRLRGFHFVSLFLFLFTAHSCRQQMKKKEIFLKQSENSAQWWTRTEVAVAASAEEQHRRCSKRAISWPPWTLTPHFTTTDRGPFPWGHVEAIQFHTKISRW